MMSESLQEGQKRESTLKSSQMDSGVPLSLVRGKGNERRAPEKEEGDNMAFSLLMKKGNKQMVPLTSSIPSQKPLLN